LTGSAGCIADFGGKFRHDGAGQGDEIRQASPGKDGTIEGLVTRAGAARARRLARPITALRV
jgi:hypothetical protein